MSEERQERMQVLMDKNTSGDITPEEHDELTQLVERSQQLTLRKSEAVALLTKRGYSVSKRDLV
jgi:hypothetical protein